MKILRNGDGAVFDSPDGPVPSGFTLVPGSFQERVEARKGTGALNRTPLPFVTTAAESGLGALGMGPERAKWWAETIVPQTYGGAIGGALIGGLGTPLRPALQASVGPGRALLERAGRIALPALGAGATSAAVGESPSETATSTALGAVGGEVGSAAGGALTRKFGTALGKMDVRNIADALEKVSPAAASMLRNVRTPADLSDVMRAGLARRALGSEFEGRLNDIMSKASSSAPASGLVESQLTPGRFVPMVKVDALKPNGLMRLDEAFNELRLLRRKAWLPSGELRGTATAMDTAAIRTRASEQVEDALNQISSQLGGAFRGMNQSYRQGMAGVNLFDPKKSGRMFEKGFDPDVLRRTFEAQESQLRQSLPKGIFEQLRTAVYRGAENAPIRRDVPLTAADRPGGMSMHLPGTMGLRSFLHFLRPPRYIGDIPRTYRLGEFPNVGVALPLQEAVGATLNRPRE